MGKMTTTHLSIEGETLSEIRGGMESDYQWVPIGSTPELMSTIQTVTEFISWRPNGRQDVQGSLTEECLERENSSYNYSIGDLWFRNGEPETSMSLTLSERSDYLQAVN